MKKKIDETMDELLELWDRTPKAVFGVIATTMIALMIVLSVTAFKSAMAGPREVTTNANVVWSETDDEAAFVTWDRVEGGLCVEVRVDDDEPVVISENISCLRLENCGGHHVKVSVILEDGTRVVVVDEDVRY